MTTLKAIHFPETTLSSHDVMGQLLLFNTISYIIPTTTEEEPDPFCPTYDPAPLGEEDANRFNQLLEELKGNETAFYQGQMSTLALEYLETRDDDTVRDIIKAVHGEEVKKKSPEQQKEFDTLWKARLLLKLAEMMRHEEQDVYTSLQRIKDAQKDMLGDLKGEQEFHDLFNAITNTLPKQLPVRIESLIKAWGQLFMAHPEPFTILHCYTRDAAEPFMEVSESITGQRPARIIQLILPENSASPQEFFQNKKQWQEKNKIWLTTLKTALHTVTQQGLDEASLSTFTKMADQWTQHIEYTNQASTLEIYLLGDNLPSLLEKLCTIKNKTNHQESPYTLLAVVATHQN